MNSAAVTLIGSYLVCKKIDQNKKDQGGQKTSAILRRICGTCTILMILLRWKSNHSKITKTQEILLIG